MGIILEKIKCIFQMGKEMRKAYALNDFSVLEEAKGEEEIIHRGSRI